MRHKHQWRKVGCRWDGDKMITIKRCITCKAKKEVYD